METSRSTKFKFSHLPSLLVDTYREWMADEPFRLSATVAYYAVLSLPALLVIILNIVGHIWGFDTVQERLTAEFSSTMGTDTAKSIETMMRRSDGQNKGMISTIIGIATLVYGATGVFYQLKVSLNRVWSIKPKEGAAVKKIIINRARSLAFILVIGFLLLTSFALSAAVAAISDTVLSRLPETMAYLTYILNFIISLALVTLLFALLYKYLPDADISWRTVWVGAFFTALLFISGKILLGLYFAQTDPGSTYGAAGTIVLILLWASYSCLILFFGAEFTYIYSQRYGHGILPNEVAKKGTVINDT